MQETQNRSHGSEWNTPPEVALLAYELFDGPPDTEPMSGAVFYPEDDHGLSLPWYGRVLLNPPVEMRVPAVRKLLSLYRNSQIEEAVVLLNAAAITARWFAPLLQHLICVPSRRIAHGSKGSAAGAVVVYTGPRPGRFAEVFSTLGTVLGPVNPELSSTIIEAQIPLQVAA